MTSGERTDDERQDALGRINTLVDGVVAIAITLLALDLKPDLPSPAGSHQLGHYLHQHLGLYGSFAIAFFLVAQYWTLHRRLMSGVVRTSGALVRVTLVFLFGITLAPLTASLTGTYDNRLATFLFAMNILLIGTSTGLLGEVIRRQRLDGVQENREQRARREIRAVTIVLIAGAVGGLSWVIGTHAAYLYLLFFVADAPGAVVGKRLRPRPTAGR